ncbi:helix-turn-helix domain-containing protein [Streptomyces sp. H10-C2]|uniref:helix-turn-helix domain-containing protein n=1 Tax=Streptomyces TaxID=1883 RepID=UPI0018DF1EEA|nr:MULTISPECIES: helix-turn-helix domain-containing protein [Streptomyces]MDJ0344231.1 helix-turn-helix domain-containing protein [Streptomyces sp. PH10-H1]MDJ0373569.1 helix-turn-helix domain-containing protein [Streptomyces sp. H10-C2]
MIDGVDGGLLSGYPDVLTLEEVAGILRLQPRQARTLAAKGKIANAFKVGGVWRFHNVGELLSGYPDVLTLEEVAGVLRIKPRHVRTLAAKRGLADAFKVGGLWRFSRSALVALIAGEGSPQT